MFSLHYITDIPSCDRVVVVDVNAKHMTTVATQSGSIRHLIATPCCLSSVRTPVQIDGIIIRKTYGFWTWQFIGFIFVQHFVRKFIRKVQTLKSTMRQG